jgi:hypothetical protein
MRLVEIPPANISPAEELFPASHERSAIDKYSFQFTPLSPLREVQANHALIEPQAKWSFARKI